MMHILHGHECYFYLLYPSFHLGSIPTPTYAIDTKIEQKRRRENIVTALESMLY